MQRLRLNVPLLYFKWQNRRPFFAYGITNTIAAMMTQMNECPIHVVIVVAMETVATLRLSTETPPGVGLLTQTVGPTPPTPFFKMAAPPKITFNDKLFSQKNKKHVTHSSFISPSLRQPYLSSTYVLSYLPPGIFLTQKCTCMLSIEARTSVNVHVFFLRGDITANSNFFPTSDATWNEPRVHRFFGPYTHRSKRCHKTTYSGLCATELAFSDRRGDIKIVSSALLCE